MEKDNIVEQFVADFDDGVVVSFSSFPPELPREVWEHIFSYIKDSASLVTCSHICKYWSELLHKRKAVFCFPLTLPFLEPYLSNNELLACRQVCTSWKGTMDEHRQSEEEVPPWDRSRFFGRGLVVHAGDEPPDRHNNPLGCTFFAEEEDSDDDPRNFLEAMKNHPGNPFPTRSVIVDVESAEAYSHFQGMLQKFGKEIRVMVFICRGDDDDANTGASQIQHIFNHCTNLTSLSLLMPDSWERHDVRNSLRWMTAPPTQLPEIPSLVSLNIYGDGSGSVAEALLEKYGKQLERLEVNQEVIKDRSFLTPGYLADSNTERAHILSNLLPNLNTLKVRNQGRLSEALETLQHCNFGALERLSFCDNLEFPGQPLTSFRLLVRTISTFSASLVQLFLPIHKDKLRLMMIGVDDENGCSALLMGVQFPKLTMLGVSYSMMNSWSLERLLRKFVVLEELIFYDYRCFRVDSSVLPEKREHYLKTKWRQMLEKLEKVWELLPTLQRISVNREISHAKNIFLLSRPRSTEDLENQREAAVVALWDSFVYLM